MGKGIRREPGKNTDIDTFAGAVSLDFRGGGVELDSLAAEVTQIILRQIG